MHQKEESDDLLKIHDAMIEELRESIREMTEVVTD